MDATTGLIFENLRSMRLMVSRSTGTFWWTRSSIRSHSRVDTSGTEEDLAIRVLAYCLPDGNYTDAQLRAALKFVRVVD